MIRPALLALLAALSIGCISSAPTQPVTPQTQAQVSACQTDASWHNGVVIGDTAVGVGATTLGTVSALDTNPNDKTAFAVGAAIAAGLGVVGVFVANYTASNFANSQCSSVVGPLPATPLGKPKPDSQ